MSVVVVDPPSRSVGRKSRFTDEDIQDFCNAVKSGNWAWDSEPTTTESCAYQRAQAAVKRMRAEHSIDASTHAKLVDEDHPEKGYEWSIGPVQPGKRRGRKPKVQADPLPAAA